MKKLVEKFGKKRVYGTAIGLLVLIAIAVSSGIYAFANQSALDLKKDVFVIEYGETISMDPKTYLKENTDKKVLNNSKVLIKLNSKTPTDVGTYKGTIEYKEETIDLKIDVKDTTSPEFIELKKEIVIEQNAENLKLETYFKAKDLSDFEITIDKGKFDLSKLGKYEIKAIATDKYKNVKEAKVTVKVVSLAEAEKGNVTTLLDGSTPISKTLKEKRESDAKAKEENKSVEEKPQDPVDNKGTGTSTTPPPTTNTGNGSGNNNQTVPTPPTACSFTGYVNLGNSGMTFGSGEEADAWAKEQRNIENGPWSYEKGYFGNTSWTVLDNCGEEHNNVWTVNFY